MFDYARNMQLAVSDMARRAGMMAGAGVVALIGLGFLIAALWTWLAHHLGWGSLGASLAVGGLFLIVGLVLMLLGRSVRHKVPSPEELRAEVEARMSLAADAALEKARMKATEVVDTVENRVHAVVDNVAYRATRFADDAEQRVHGIFGGVTSGVKSAGTRMGFTAENLDAARESLGDIRDKISDTAERVTQSRAATIPPLIGAFAVGIALASRLQSWRHRDDDDLDDHYA